MKKLPVKPQDKCGIFAAVSKNGPRQDIGQYLYIGIGSLQHRGKESAGMSVSEGGNIKTHKGEGMVGEVFAAKYSESVLDTMTGNAGIAHTRYSTRGKSGKVNVHPIEFEFKGRPAAIAHNGNLVNVESLKQEVENRGGYDFGETLETDTALIAAYIATSKHKDFWLAFMEALNSIEGAFSLVALYNDTVYAAKDLFGLRPLALAKTEEFIFASSETCALDTLGAQFMFELNCGEMCLIEKDVVVVKKWPMWEEPKYKSCVFEGIYLSRPDSLLRQTARVGYLREVTGRVLAQEHPLLGEQVDIVMPVPDSGNSAAVGYREQIKQAHPESRFKLGIIRPHHIGRTFIEPVKEKRRQFQRMKHNIVPDVVKHKNVVLVDDSIVRSTTMSYLVAELKRFGANKVFVLSASPPLKYPCHLGVDFPTHAELIAHNKNIEAIRAEIGADYLGYLSLDGLREAYELCDFDPDSFCYGCMTDNYPVPFK